MDTTKERLQRVLQLMLLRILHFTGSALLALTLTGCWTSTTATIRKGDIELKLELETYTEEEGPETPIAYGKGQTGIYPVSERARLRVRRVR